MLYILELASNTAAFAKSAATLGNAEEHTALSRALAQLSEAFEKVEGLHQEIANSDFFNVSEVIADYIRIIAEIKVSWSDCNYKFSNHI